MRPASKTFVSLVTAALLLVAGAASAAETKPAVVRGDTWHLRDSLSGGPATTTFDYGDPSDLPLMGDWDGDGDATPGVFRDGLWILSNTYDQADAFTVGYGRAADKPIAGDWDGDGDDDLGVVRGNRWYLDIGLTGGRGEREYSYGRATDTPVAGDWDGVASQMRWKSRS